jgi:hypothetical protein
MFGVQAKACRHAKAWTQNEGQIPMLCGFIYMPVYAWHTKIWTEPPRHTAAHRSMKNQATTLR